MPMRAWLEQPCRCQDFSPYCACRVGEARHPGPLRQPSITSFFGNRPECVDKEGGQLGPRKVSRVTASVAKQRAQPDHRPGASTLSLAVVNPTSVPNKAPDLLSMNKDVPVMAETSAVAKTRQMVGKQLRPHD